MRVILIPGMGCTPTARSNWYSWFAQEMNQRPTVHECLLRDFPDPHQCKESIWIPFLEEKVLLQSDPANTILVGHSSGAACAMRLLEKQGKQAIDNDDDTTTQPFRGVILVAAAYTDLGDATERRSEYFNRPWDWDSMKRGARHIVCFHGSDDPLIPCQEARHISQQLQGDNYEYREMNGQSHFFQPWDEILQVMDSKLLQQQEQEEDERVASLK